MKENEHKSVEQLIGKIMRPPALETPSVDFTSLVMEKIEALEASSATTYQPLISKRAWLVIFGTTILFLIAIVWILKPETSGWLTTMDYSFLSSTKFSNILNGINFSDTTSLSILMFAVMLLIQIPLLKNYFDKRMLS